MSPKLDNEIVHNINRIISKHFVAFPVNCPTFQNPLENKEQICFNFKNKRGCYLWTHNKSGKQYIGSSRNLSLRLSEYFRDSYLILQSDRGSAICRALKKYGYNDFSLSIMVLGISPSQNTNYSSDNFPDFLVMEQHYLDNYILDYNVNRVASSNYQPSRASVNKGTANPSYDLKDDKAFVWDRTHSKKLKSRWSETRGKFTFYLYSSNTFELIETFSSTVSLSAFLKFSTSFGGLILELIRSTDYCAVIYKEYIISLTSHSVDVLSTSWKLFPVKKEVGIRRGSNSVNIYGFNPSTNEYKNWSSKADCVKDISGEKLTNSRTINKRIDKNILYKGFYLQTDPFK